MSDQHKEDGVFKRLHDYFADENGSLFHKENIQSVLGGLSIPPLVLAGYMMIGDPDTQAQAAPAVVPEVAQITEARVSFRYIEPPETDNAIQHAFYVQTLVSDSVPATSEQECVFNGTKQVMNLARGELSSMVQVDCMSGENVASRFYCVASDASEGETSQVQFSCQKGGMMVQNDQDDGLDYDTMGLS